MFERIKTLFNADLVEQIDNLHEKNDSLKYDCELTERRLETANKKISCLEQEIKDQDFELSASNEKHDQQVIQLSEYSNQVRTQENELEKIRKALGDSEITVKQLNEKLKKAEAVYESDKKTLENERNLIQIELDTCRQRISELENKPVKVKKLTARRKKPDDNEKPD